MPQFDKYPQLQMGVSLEKEKSWEAAFTFYQGKLAELDKNRDRLQQQIASATQNVRREEDRMDRFRHDKSDQEKVNSAKAILQLHHAEKIDADRMTAIVCGRLAICYQKKQENKLTPGLYDSQRRYLERAICSQKLVVNAAQPSDEQIAQDWRDLAEYQFDMAKLEMNSNLHQAIRTMEEINHAITQIFIGLRTNDDKRLISLCSQLTGLCLSHELSKDADKGIIAQIHQHFVQAVATRFTLSGLNADDYAFIRECYQYCSQFFEKLGRKSDVVHYTLASALFAASLTRNDVESFLNQMNMLRFIEPSRRNDPYNDTVTVQHFQAMHDCLIFFRDHCYLDEFPDSPFKQSMKEPANRASLLLKFNECWGFMYSSCVNRQVFSNDALTYFIGMYGKLIGELQKLKSDNELLRGMLVKHGVFANADAALPSSAPVEMEHQELSPFNGINP